MHISQIAHRLEALTPFNARLMVGVAGPPGSGKSTLAQALEDRLSGARVVPMDGFHLDNDTLDARGLRSRKGAPDTFDAQGFVDLITRLRAGQVSVEIPEFDRAQDRVVWRGQEVGQGARIVIVEGNYLLLKGAPWDRLAPLLDHRIFLAPPLETLEARLTARWRAHGYDDAQAVAKAASNDLPNAKLVLAHSTSADLCLGDVGFDC